MEYLDLIIKCGAVITALGVIVGLFVKFWKIANKMKETIDKINGDLAELKAHSDENYMGILRLTIMSSEMPIGERIVAGDKYLKNNGNGAVKKFLKEEFDITDTVENSTHYTHKKGR